MLVAPKMLDQAARAEAWTGWTESTFGLNLEAAECMALACIPTHPYKPIWMFYNSRRHHLWEEYRTAFESLGATYKFSEWHCEAFLNPTMHRAWLDLTHREFFNYRSNPTERETYIRSRTLSCNCVLPPGPNLHQGEMAAQLRRVVGLEHRRVYPHPISPSPQLMEYILCLIRLMPYADEQAVIDACCLVPSARAALYGRSEITDEDHEFLLYIMSSSIHWTFRNVLFGAAEDPTISFTYMDAYVWLGVLGVGVGSRVKRVLLELVKSGALKVRGANTRRGMKRWIVPQHLRRAMNELVEGTARWW